MIRLDNGLMRLDFDEVSGALTHLIDLEGGVAHIGPPGPSMNMWKLVFRAGTEEATLLWPSWKGEFVGKVDREADGAQVATLAWTGMWFKHEPKCVDVIVTVRLPKDSAASEWRIKVNNRSERYGLWEVRFPWFDKWPLPKSYDVAIPWQNWGHNYPKLAEKRQGDFSSYMWAMQFFLLTTGNRGLSVAAHDPDQNLKSYVVDPGNETAMAIRVPDGTKPGVGLDETFPFVIESYEGGWLEGCKLYRSWALKQKWCRKGPISQRKDVPKALTDIGLWFVTSINDNPTPEYLKEWSDRIIEAAKYYEVPVAAQVYHWHMIKGDCDYPEYFPAKPGAGDAIRRIVEAGVAAAPYINARLWDYRAKSYPQGLPALAKDPAGVPYLEIYGPESSLLQPACTQTKVWQDIVFDLCKRIFEELGANAVYLDQIAAMPAAPCYDPTHGHPLGGGHHWHDGFRVILDRVKEYMAQSGRELFLTTENPGDAHIDGCDAFLIWVPRQETEVPMMNAVYSGYTLYYSSPHTTGEGMQSFVMAQARDFLWGSQLGWMGEGLGDPFRGYLKKLAKLRVQTRKFLTFGEYAGELINAAPLAISGGSDEMIRQRVAAAPAVSANWPNFDGQKLATLPAVLTAIWRAEDGTLGLFIANLSEHRREHKYTFSPEKYGLGTGKLTYTSIDEGGRGATTGADGGMQTRTETLEPFGVAIYEVAKA